MPTSFISFCASGTPAKQYFFRELHEKHETTACILSIYNPTGLARRWTEFGAVEDSIEISTFRFPVGTSLTTMSICARRHQVSGVSSGSGAISELTTFARIVRTIILWHDFPPFAGKVCETPNSHRKKYAHRKREHVHSASLAEA